MNRFPTLLALVCCSISTGGVADEELGKGKILVATENVQGLAFAETVILLLNYDATGAAGLIVNRPTEALPAQALPTIAGIDRYDGRLYWGGPVELFTVRALVHSDLPPDNALSIFGAVYLVPLQGDMLDPDSGMTNLRFFVGYAGWAPGQLERELAIGSWHVVGATEALVFGDEPDELWRRLVPTPVHTASVRRIVSSSRSAE